VSRYFDLHIVANELPPRLDAALQELGYRHKRVVGGDQRVLMKYLLSQKRFSRRAADEIYASTVRAVDQHPSFNGYVEEEAVAHDLSFSGRGGGELCRFPLRLTASDCPPDTYKRCDVHVATSYEDSTAIRGLREAGFYSQILEKPTQGRVQVATVQAEGLVLGKQLWKHVVCYLSQCDEFVGSAKFEVTLQLHNFNYSLPPMVRGA
jgi:hypothetical protein